MRKTIIAGNWKMNGLKADSKERVENLANLLKDFKKDVEVVVCPSFPLLSYVSDLTKQTKIKIGGQDCHFNEKGAHTGDVSVAMLKDCGCQYVILGHSERRANHFENDDLVKQKLIRAISAGLKVILCVGETKDEKEKGLTLKVVETQLKGSLLELCNAENTIIAYEPVWAIGTGLTPTNEDIQNTHKEIRNMLVNILNKDVANNMSLLYGGSLNPKNAKEILALADVDGGLIGGASLLAQDFYTIIENIK
jgi:triosephosphate isomerase